MIMKKLAILGMGLCIALAFSSCKSSESAYKKAYEKAKQQELAEPQTAEPVEVAPTVTAPVEARGKHSGCNYRCTSGKSRSSIWRRWFERLQCGLW